MYGPAVRRKRADGTLMVANQQGSPVD